jgi:hypothetical protein
MMHGQKFLMEAMGEPNGMSRSAMALCSAIIEDAEMAREFELEPRGALELLHAVMPGSAYAYREAALSPRELTSLIA